MIKAIIFDMDGLMIDSERVTFECYQERLKDMNLTMDEEFYKTLLPWHSTVDGCGDRAVPTDWGTGGRRPMRQRFQG